MISVCCKAKIRRNSRSGVNYCHECGKRNPEQTADDLAPALRDSKEVLEFVEKIKKEELSKGMTYGEQRAWVQGFIDACYKINNFIIIEGKE